MTAAAETWLTLLYVVPVAIVAVLLSTHSRRPRWLVSALLIGLPVFYIGHYQMIQAIRGWPSDAALPEQFQLLGFRISEPDTRRGDDGEILLWVQGLADPRPRVHRLAYQKALHIALAQAGQRQSAGISQVGSRKPQGSASAADPSRESAGIAFRDQPKPTLPAKPGDH